MKNIRFYSGFVISYSLGETSWSENFSLDDFCSQEKTSIVGYDEGNIGSFYSISDAINGFIHKHEWKADRDSKIFVKTRMYQNLDKIEPASCILFSRLLNERGTIPSKNEMDSFFARKRKLNVVQIELQLNEYTSKPASTGKVQQIISSLNNKEAGKKPATSKKRHKKKK